MNIKILLSLFLLFSFSVQSETCEESLNELFANYSGGRSKIDEFLEIQAGITYHKTLVVAP